MPVEGKTVALLVAAGSGSRAGGDVPKQYRRLAGKPILRHALDGLRHSGIQTVQVVIGADQEKRYRDLAEGGLSPPVIGGATRQQSVRNGLEALALREEIGTVLIHDAARPFVPAAVIDRLLEAVITSDGAVPVLPLADSIALGGPTLGDTVPREHLVRVQTPQAFRFKAILAAHRRWSGTADAVDDAQVLRAAGGNVVTVPGDPAADKLTFAEDFARAERLLETVMTSRTGIGLDVHGFKDGDHVWLGGIRVPHTRGLAGHSDADVALHALCDALLGAIGAGDIGDHFPASDPQWRGTASARFVERVRELVLERGGHIDHVDMTIICESPRVGPHKEAMRDTIAALLQVAPARVSVKATTTERLGFTGRGEGIAAQAVATIRLPEVS